MHGFMAAGTPTGPSSQSAGATVVGSTNDDAGRSLLLEVAAQAEVGIAGHQHFFIHRAVRVVANSAAFAHSFMLEDKWSALCGMAIATGLLLREQRGSTTANRRTAVRIMTIAAAHFAAQDRMTVRQLKLAAFIKMTLKAGFR